MSLGTLDQKRLLRMTPWNLGNRKWTFDYSKTIDIKTNNYNSGCLHFRNAAVQL